MAHKGRPWRLALRRDFNLNVQNYARGLAHSYDVHFNPFIGSPPNDLNGVDFQPAESAMPNVSTLRWTDTGVHSGSSVFDLTMDLSVGGLPTGATRILTVSKVGLGVIYQAQYGAAGDTSSSWSAPGVAILVFNLAFFITKGFDQFAVIAATPY